MSAWLLELFVAFWFSRKCLSPSPVFAAALWIILVLGTLLDRAVVAAAA